MEMPQCIPLIYRFERSTEGEGLTPIDPERPSRMQNTAGGARILRGEFLAEVAVARLEPTASRGPHSPLGLPL